jgi:hypothetical protein
MVEVHTKMMRVLTQDMVNHDTKELPPGMQQVLDDHSRIVQMMSQIMTSTSNDLPQSDHGSKKPRYSAEILLQAYKICGGIGHMFKECHEQCPYCNTNHPNKESLWPGHLFPMRWNQPCTYGM